MVQDDLQWKTTFIGRQHVLNMGDYIMETSVEDVRSLHAAYSTLRHFLHIQMSKRNYLMHLFYIFLLQIIQKTRKFLVGPKTFNQKLLVEFVKKYFIPYS